MQNTQLDKNILSKIYSKDSEQTKEAIEEIKEKKDSRYLPALFELFKPETPDLVKENILTFIRDLKSQDSVPLIMEMLSKTEEEEDLVRLASACWQSRLDFGNYLHNFVSLIIGYNYQVALEAYTVIENSIFSIDKDHLPGEIDRLKGALGEISEEKKPLVMEAIKSLQES